MQRKVGLNKQKYGTNYLKNKHASLRAIVNGSSQAKVRLDLTMRLNVKYSFFFDMGHPPKLLIFDPSLHFVYSDDNKI